MLHEAAAARKDPAELERQIAALKSELLIEKTRRARAEFKLQQYLRRLFGSRSEKLDVRQLELLMGQIAADQTLIEEAQPVAAVAVGEASPAPKRGGGRRAPPPHLSVEVTVLDVPEADRVGMTKIREEITEEYEYDPARYFLHRIVRPVYADPRKERAPVVAALPARIIPQSGAGAGLLAHILVSKYVDHLPLNRLQAIAARSGVPLGGHVLFVQRVAVSLLHSSIVDAVAGLG